MQRRRSLWIKYKNLLTMAKGFIKHDVTKIDHPSQLVDNIDEFKRKLSPSVKKEHKNPSLLNFMNKTEMEKEIIRVHLKESAHKIITE